MEFRTLKPEEISVRVGQVGEKGATLLLYKDARADMTILDETVGPMNWQRKHEVINGNLYCSVGIFGKELDMWVWKEDVGIESNTEKEKGEASDAFKRACVNWGIGRELYTAPFIFIQAETVPDGNKYRLKKPSDLYGMTVTAITYTKNREIEHIRIVDKKNVPIFQR